VSPLSLLTFFAAAKKVSAAPHRGNTNRPTRIQGKAKKLRNPNKQKNRQTNKKPSAASKKQKKRQAPKRPQRSQSKKRKY
jgi:hypothetical protein